MDNTNPLAVEEIPSYGQSNTTYMVTERTHQIETRVYYAYSLDEAQKRKQWCVDKYGSDWQIAIVLN